MCPLILSNSIILEGETYDQQVDAVLSIMKVCGKRFQWWAEVLEHSHPSYQSNIPDPSSMKISKLGSDSDLASDTCNGVFVR